MCSSPYMLWYKYSITCMVHNIDHLHAYMIITGLSYSLALRCSNHGSEGWSTGALKRQVSSISSETPEFDSCWRMEEWEQQKLAKKKAADPLVKVPSPAPSGNAKGPTPTPAEDSNAVTGVKDPKSPPGSEPMPESKAAAAKPGSPAEPEEESLEEDKVNKYDKYYHQTFILCIRICKCMLHAWMRKQHIP